MSYNKSIADIYAHFKFHGFESYQAQLKRVNNNRIVLKLTEGNSVFQTLPLRIDFLKMKVLLFNDVHELINNLLCYCDKKVSTKRKTSDKIKPEMLHRIKAKYNLSRDDIALMTSVNSRTVGYWLVGTKPIPMACWKILLIDLGESKNA